MAGRKLKDIENRILTNRDFGPASDLETTISWLKGKHQDEVDVIRAEYLLKVSEIFGLSDDQLVLLFDKIWRTISVFMERRGRSAGKLENIQESAGKRPEVDRVLKLQMQAAQAFERLTPLDSILWSGRVALAAWSDRSNRKLALIFPQVALLHGATLSSAVCATALRSFTSAKPGVRKNPDKCYLLRNVCAAWEKVTGEKASNSEQDGKFLHFINLMLPLATHEIRVSVFVKNQNLAVTDVNSKVSDIPPEGGGEYLLVSGPVQTEQRPIWTGVINFQQECRNIATRKNRAEIGTHYLSGSFQRWIKERKAAAIPTD